MAAITKLIALVLLICFVAAICEVSAQGSEEHKGHQSQDANNENQRKDHRDNQPQGGPRRFQKRSVDHEDGDAGDDFMATAFKNGIVRPHRIRVMPGYLH